MLLGKAEKSHYSCLSKMIEKGTPEIKEKRASRIQKWLGE